MIHKLISSRLFFPIFGGIIMLSSFSIAQALPHKISEIKKTNCNAICVSITPHGMTPPELAVQVGQSVQFNTADGLRHNLGLGDGHEESHQGADGHQHETHEHVGSYESGEFGVGEAFRVQFKNTGTFTFHDHLHPEDNIVIVVYQPKSS